jgi:hypothetical protein
MGGKACVYNNGQCDDCDDHCSIPVYDVSCPDCGMVWTLGEDELIEFFSMRRRSAE